MAIERELLTKCGLNSTEQEVLLYLLENGRTRPALIAQRTGKKRSTVYSALNNLVELGLVGKYMTGSSALYSVIDPEVIPAVFIGRAKGEFEKVTQAALMLESHLREYKLEARKKVGGYEISTIDAPDAAFAFLEKILVQGEYRGIFNPQTAFATPRSREVGERCLNITGRTKPTIQEIAVGGPQCDWWMQNIKNPNHIVKEVGMTPTLVTDLLLHDGSVILMNYDAGREMCIYIKHPDYYQFMLEVFDLLWSKL